jgi:hypothetical protein
VFKIELYKLYTGKLCDIYNIVFFLFSRSINFFYLLFEQMYAELQVLSPLVPTRETYFLRFCHQNVEEGTWAIVDFPLDRLHDNIQPSFPLYKRHPSGCVIQDMPNGYSRVYTSLNSMFSCFYLFLGGESDGKLS